MGRVDKNKLKTHHEFNGIDRKRILSEIAAKLCSRLFFSSANSSAWRNPGVLLCALQINWKKNIEKFVRCVIPPDKVTDDIAILV